MLKRQSELQYLWRYACTGGLNAVVGLSSIFGLMSAGVPALYANVSGYALGLVLAFFTARTFVFKSRGGVVQETVRYLIAFGISFLVNLAALRIAMHTMQIQTDLAQIIAISTYVVVMYFMNRVFVFPVSRRAEKLI